jgi:hypothetical protein
MKNCDLSVSDRFLSLTGEWVKLTNVVATTQNEFRSIFCDDNTKSRSTFRTGEFLDRVVRYPYTS